MLDQPGDDQRPAGRLGFFDVFEQRQHFFAVPHPEDGAVHHVFGGKRVGMVVGVVTLEDRALESDDVESHLFV